MADVSGAEGLGAGASGRSIWQFKRTQKNRRVFAMTCFEREAEEDGYTRIAGWTRRAGVR